MPTLASNYLTLADVFKRTDGDDKIAAVIELLSQTNAILDDAVVMECNDGTKHLTTVRTGLPSATWRKLYQGVQPQKSTTKQVTDATGSLETWSEIDAKLVDISGDPNGLRLSEATAFLEGMNNDMATGLFYNDTAVDPEKFMGLAPRFSSLSAENGGQIVDAGGVGSDNTSMWFVVWGERTCHLLYPKGSKGGIIRDDKGKQTKTNSDGSVLDVYREKFSWDIGMSVRDWRYIVRIANIDVSDMIAGNVDLLKFMRKAYWKLQQRKIIGGKAAIYCNADVMEAIDAAYTSKANVWLSKNEAEGGEVLSYRGLPIRECDALLNTEARVV